MRMVALELAKMRRIRHGAVQLAAVVAVVLFSTMQLFSQKSRAKLTDPLAQPWQQLLLAYATSVAMLSPIVLAVLASRQVDIEHQGRGWDHARGAGIAAATVLRTKVVALGLVVTAAWLIQTAVVIALGRLTGISVPMNWADWWGYGVRGLAVNLAILAMSVWLAARFENQLITLGVGLVGGFLAFYCFLFPPWVSVLVPWGYFALITPYQMTQHMLVPAQTPVTVGVLIAFLLLTVALFWWASARFDRQES